MTPLEARRLTGRPDIVERLRNFPVGPSDMMEPMREGAAEIERLRAVLRAVLTLTHYTDHDWAVREIEDAVLRGLGES